MYTLSRPSALTISRSVPNRPAISDVLLKASANVAFRMRLLTNPEAALAGLNLPPEDVEVLAGVASLTLPEFAQQIQMRLTADRLVAESPCR